MPSVRIAQLALLATLVVGLVALALSWNDSRHQQNLGVSVVGSVATLVPHGPELCAGPIGLGEPADAVTFNPSAQPPDTPALEVVIRNVNTGAILAEGGVKAGFNPAEPQTANLTPTVSTAHDISLCIRDVGARDVSIFGVPGGGLACANAHGGGAECSFGHALSTTTTLHVGVGGRLVAGQISAVFSSPPISIGTLLRNTFAHASLFRPSFVGSGFWWALLVVLLLGVPTLLVRSIRALYDEDTARSGERE
jgi:hypothetical protein